MERMSEHTGLISSYQLLTTAAWTNTGGKMKGSHSRAADLCPFVPRHSLCQVTSFMQLVMLCQFGYLKLHSLAIALTDKIKKLLDDGNYVIGIYLDVPKAFDTVNHKILLNKLWRYGIRGHTNDLSDPIWPTDDSTHVQMKKKSITRPVKFGVPQGSVLGPLLLILYMNDIVKSVHAKKTWLYSDWSWTRDICNVTVDSLILHRYCIQ